MRFEWDENKRLENLRKHGIDFHDVPVLFDGPLLNRLDDRLDYGEVRWTGIGAMGPTGIVVVVYTEPDQEVIRIISARKANRYERSKFQQQIYDRLGAPRRSDRRRH